jgi:hypothetical protein
MEDKKIKLQVKQQKDPSEFDINSGEIFTELQNTYQNYSTDFLRKEVWIAYKKLVASVPIISFPDENDFEPKGYLQSQERLYRQSQYGEVVNGLFPFHNSCIFYQGGEPVGLGYFEHRYTVKNTDPSFDLFFTLKVLQTDIIQIEKFLNYQLTQSFEENHIRYTSFLKVICLKFFELLEKKYNPFITDFIEQHLKDNKSDPQEIAPGYTLTRQVLIMHYLLKKAGVEMRAVVGITDVSRIVQGITSRQLGAKEISNTEIYKRLKNPLKGTSEIAFQKDLRFVRDVFEKLSLMEIVEEINKEITDRD